MRVSAVRTTEVQSNGYAISTEMLRMKALGIAQDILVTALALDGSGVSCSVLVHSNEVKEPASPPSHKMSQVSLVTEEKATSVVLFIFSLLPVEASTAVHQAKYSRKYLRKMLCFSPCNGRTSDLVPKSRKT